MFLPRQKEKKGREKKFLLQNDLTTNWKKKKKKIPLNMLNDDIDWPILLERRHAASQVNEASHYN